MKGWLEKILASPHLRANAPKLPTLRQGSGNLPGQQLRPLPPAASLPNATVIYGIGASLMFVAAFFLLLQGRWFPAFIVVVLGACLVGFALHLLKHQD